MAAVNAGAIFVPHTKIEDVAVAKTSIVGPAGNITKEEHLPVITHEPAFVGAPFYRYNDFPLYFGGDAVVQHQGISVIHPPEVPVIHNEVPVVHHELPVLPAIHHSRLVVKTLPHTYPYAAPFAYAPHYYNTLHGGLSYVKLLKK